jgi:hypothetical protein
MNAGGRRQQLSGGRNGRQDVQRHLYQFHQPVHPATQRPATVTGKIINASGQGIVGNFNFAWTVNNQGTIEGNGSTNGFGIQLLDGGTVNNAAGGLIADYNQAILVEFASGAVTNLGRIEGTGTNGVGVSFFDTGGQVINGSAGDTAALISGEGNGIVINGAAGSVANFGTIESTGARTTIRLVSGGSVSNGGSTSTKALISNTGGANAVYIGYGVGTVTNFGTITGNNGVVLLEGGRVANGRSGSTAGRIIGGSGGDAINVLAGAGTVTNFGTIQEHANSASGCTAVAQSPTAPPGRRLR